MSIKIIKTACLHRLELENQCLTWVTVTVTVTYKKKRKINCIVPDRCP
jgi:hypothetical protein